MSALAWFLAGMGFMFIVRAQWDFMQRKPIKKRMPG